MKPWSTLQTLNIAIIEASWVREPWAKAVGSRSGRIGGEEKEEKEESPRQKIQVSVENSRQMYKFCLNVLKKSRLRNAYAFDGMRPVLI